MQVFFQYFFEGVPFIEGLVEVYGREGEMDSKENDTMIQAGTSVTSV